MSKLNKSTNILWQKPKTGRLHFTDEEWYDKRPVGKDMLERFMKISLSKNIKLKGDYTNHSIRATVISTLHNDGFEARHIMTLSSHKSEATIKEYAVKCPDNKRKEMFASLSNALTPKSKQPKIAHALTNPQKGDENKENPTINDIKQNLPNFNLQPIDDFDTIDDSILANLVYHNYLLRPENINTNYNNQGVASALSPQTAQTPQTINTQVNTINQSIPMQHFSCLSQMQFNNSSVTINYNYNFSK